MELDDLSPVDDLVKHSSSAVDIRTVLMQVIFFINEQGCIICAILPSGMGARGVSSEHVENMEMFSCTPT